MPRSSFRQSMDSVLRYGILIFLCLVIMGPIATAILGSLRTTGEFMSQPFGLPKGEIQWENYTVILEDPSFWKSFRNSILITIGVTVLTVSLSSMLAFLFSRVEFRGRSLAFNIILIGLLFPLVIAILPIFIQVRQLNLTSNLWGVILPLVAFGIPQSVVILRTFFVTIPFELEDASYIDGCTTFGFFRHILIPLARPSLLAVAVLQVIVAWNDYFLSLVVLGSSPDLWPLPLGIMQFQGQYGTDYAKIMAYVTLLIIPAVLFYLMAEKYIVTGLTGGELKG